MFWSGFNHIICAKSGILTGQVFVPTLPQNGVHGGVTVEKKSTLSAVQSEACRMCNWTCTTMAKCACASLSVCVAAFMWVYAECTTAETDNVPPFHLYSCTAILHTGTYANHVNKIVLQKSRKFKKKQQQIARDFERNTVKTVKSLNLAFEVQLSLCIEFSDVQRMTCMRAQGGEEEEKDSRN